MEADLLFLEVYTITGITPESRFKSDFMVACDVGIAKVLEYTKIKVTLKVRRDSEVPQHQRYFALQDAYRTLGWTDLSVHFHDSRV